MTYSQKWPKKHRGPRRVAKRRLYPIKGKNYRRSREALAVPHWCFAYNYSGITTTILCDG